MAAVKIAVIGLGAITQSVHLPLLVRLRADLQVVALVDLSATRATEVAGRYGIGAHYRSTAELLAARAEGRIDLDGVLIATTGSHGTDALDCVRAGLAVLVEKPLSMSMAEIEAIAAEPEARVQVGYMKEHDPATAAAATHLAGRQVRAVDVEVLHPSGSAQLSYAHLLPPAGDMDPGALTAVLDRTEAAITEAIGPEVPQRWRSLYERVVLGSIIHDVSLLRHLLGGIGRVEHAVAWGERGGDDGSVELTGTMAGTDGADGVGGADGVAGHQQARVHLGWHYLPGHADYRETVTVHHDSGTVHLVFGIPYLLNSPTVLTVVSRAEDGAEVRAEYRWNQREAFESQLLAFAAMVTDGATPLSGPDQARADLLVAWQVMDRLGQRHGFDLAGEAAAHLTATSAPT